MLRKTKYSVTRCRSGHDLRVSSSKGKIYSAECIDSTIDDLDNDVVCVWSHPYFIGIYATWKWCDTPQAGNHLTNIKPFSFVLMTMFVAKTVSHLGENAIIIPQRN